MLSLSLENNRKQPNLHQHKITEVKEMTYIFKSKKENKSNRTSTSSNDSLSTNANSSVEEERPFIKTSISPLDSPISSLPQFKTLEPSLLNSNYKQVIKEEQIKNHHLYLNYTSLNINEAQRAILIDWLVNVHLFMNFSDECLFLSVKIVDSFLSKVHSFHKSKLQLLGLVAILLSSKFIESCHPYMEDLCSLCDNAYTEKEIRFFEREVLKTLDYSIEQDPIVNFFDMLCLIFKFNLNEYYMGKYLLELTLLDSSFYKYRRTLLAFSAVYIVMKMNLERHSNYKECFSYLKNKESTEAQMKMCGKQILHIMDKTKETNQYTSSLQKLNLKIKEKKQEEDVEMIL